MQGIRRDLTELDGIPEPGWYGKMTDGHWYGVAPTEPDEDGFPLVANLSGHQVVEYDDRTITVSPSILIGPDYRGRSWHGFLERGIWREA